MLYEIDCKSYVKHKNWIIREKHSMVLFYVLGIGGINKYVKLSPYTGHSFFYMVFFAL